MEVGGPEGRAGSFSPTTTTSPQETSQAVLEKAVLSVLDPVSLQSCVRGVRENTDDGKWAVMPLPSGTFGSTSKTSHLMKRLTSS